MAWVVETLLVEVAAPVGELLLLAAPFTRNDALVGAVKAMTLVADWPAGRVVPVPP